jgi:hypothetical protein
MWLWLLQQATPACQVTRPNQPTAELRAAAYKSLQTCKQTALQAVCFYGAVLTEAAAGEGPSCSFHTAHWLVALP